jgi:hypothetical protein
MAFAELGRLRPRDAGVAPVWREVALEGDTTHAYHEQIRGLHGQLAEDWAVRTSPATGNPVYVRPAVLVLYRRDREFLVRPLIPTPDRPPEGYDLVIASQVYRARTPLERKVATVVAPLARALAPGGTLIGVHGYGDDPGLEIVRGVWPEEDPFRDGRLAVLTEARAQLTAAGDDDLAVDDRPDADALLRYVLHAMPSTRTEHIGTSSVLAAWSAATYVAQIDERRLAEAVASGAYLDATQAVLRRYGAVWFNDEVYAIRRRSGASA